MTDIGDYDTNFKMNPPLRSASDREALLVALADGTVDAIATDHAPHAPQEKIIEFERAAFGITGLETALGLAITRLHREQRFRCAASWNCLPQARRGLSTCAGVARSRAEAMPT